MPVFDDNNSGVPVPRYNISRYEKLREKIKTMTLLPYLGVDHVGDDFSAMVQDLAADLNVEYGVIFDSIHDLAGVQLTDPVVAKLAWRLSANIERLQDGIAVPDWSAQRWKEWMLVQVLSYEEHRTARGKLGGLFRMRVLAGTAAPRIMTTFWSVAFCGMLARRCGYTAPWHCYPFRHPSELVNMRLMALVEPEHSGKGEPGFRDVFVTGSNKKWNKRIIQLRFRVTADCPRGYTTMCYNCHVGYRECPAATHRETLQLQGPTNVPTSTQGDQASGEASHVQPPA